MSGGGGPRLDSAGMAAGRCVGAVFGRAAGRNWMSDMIDAVHTGDLSWRSFDAAADMPIFIG
jgi:hypothetical protein